MAKLKKLKTLNVKIYGIFTVLFTYIWSLSRISFTETDNSQDSRWKEGTIFYSTLPFPPAHEHWDIYFATLHVRWLSRMFNRNACVYQRATQWDLPPYLIAIWLIDWLIDYARCVRLHDDLIQGFCYSNLTPKTGEFELASTITLVLETNWLRLEPVDKVG